MARTTLADVAREAGVSVALVSIVMRDAPGASDVTRARVRDVADRLGYVPDQRARLLRSADTRLLGVTFDLHQPFHGDLVEHLYAAAAEHGYDALLVATGGRARRLATAGQDGELVLRTVADARLLRERLATAASVVVVGAVFLGLEVATAARRTAATVTVIDPEPPLVRLLGDHLATVLVGRATDHGITLRRSAVRLHGSPVRGVELDDGSVLEADVVVTCAGDVPETAWLEGSGVAGPQGVPVDASCRTRRDDVWAAGDVAAPVVDGASVRRPLWANAVTQGRVAAASMLGHEVDAPVLDDYAWTEVAGTSVKVVGRLPCSGTPRVLEESADGGRLLAFGTDTVAAVGLRRPVPRLRRALAELKASGA